MEIVARVLRWRFVISAEPDDDDGPAMSVVADSEIAPGFQPPDGYWEDEDE
jgi:hypothetical protein